MEVEVLSLCVEYVERVGIVYIIRINTIQSANTELHPSCSITPFHLTSTYHRPPLPPLPPTPLPNPLDIPPSPPLFYTYALPMHLHLAINQPSFIPVSSYQPSFTTFPRFHHPPTLSSNLTPPIPSRQHKPKPSHTPPIPIHHRLALLHRLIAARKEHAFVARRFFVFADTTRLCYSYISGWPTGKGNEGAGD